MILVTLSELLPGAASRYGPSGNVNKYCIEFFDVKPDMSISINGIGRKDLLSVMESQYHKLIDSYIMDDIPGLRYQRGWIALDISRELTKRQTMWGIDLLPDEDICRMFFGEEYKNDLESLFKNNLQIKKVKL